MRICIGIAGTGRRMGWIQAGWTSQSSQRGSPTALTTVLRRIGRMGRRRMGTGVRTRRPSGSLWILSAGLAPGGDTDTGAFQLQFGLGSGPSDAGGAGVLLQQNTNKNATTVQGTVPSGLPGLPLSVTGGATVSEATGRATGYTGSARANFGPFWLSVSDQYTEATPKAQAKDSCTFTIGGQTNWGLFNLFEKQHTPPSEPGR